MLGFLWFKNLFNKHPVELCKYRFTRVTFGENCSQFLLIFIENVSKDFEVEYSLGRFDMLIDCRMEENM